MASGTSSSRVPERWPSGNPEADGWLGRTVDGRYRVEAVLGAGGVGVVYRAVHLSLGRPVALKVLGSAFGADEALRRRFEREARILSALQHPHIVAVTDYGIAEGAPYLVMEMLEGRTLAAFLAEQGPLEPELALRLARDVLRGLAFAHGRGVLHRDLKPANVFLQALPDDPHHVKLLDFGLAKVLSKEDAAAEGDPTLTGTGVVLGTPTYMAPEQAAGDPADARADVYAAGVLLYELLTGRPPFAGRMRMEVMRAHMTETPPALREVRPELEPSPELVALLDRALAKDREDRFADAARMLEALDALPQPAARVAGTATRPRIEGRIDGEAETVAASGSQQEALAEAPGGSEDGAAEPSASLLAALPRRGGGALVRLALLGAALLIAGAVALRVSDVARRAADENQQAERRPHEPDHPPGAAAGKTQGAGARAATAANGTTAAPGPGDRAAERLARRDGEGASQDEESRRTPDRSALPPPRDPIRRGPPRGLRRPYRKVVAGRKLSTEEHRRLRRWQREHADDVRASLLLARDFARRGWYADAVERYELAFRLDPSSRGSRWMLRDLVEIAAAESRAAPAAARALERIYGPEAVRAVERAAARRLGEERRRLERLLQRLRGAP